MRARLEWGHGYDRCPAPRGHRRRSRPLLHPQLARTPAAWEQAFIRPTAPSWLLPPPCSARAVQAGWQLRGGECGSRAVLAACLTGSLAEVMPRSPAAGITGLLRRRAPPWRLPPPPPCRPPRLPVLQAPPAACRRPPCRRPVRYSPLAALVAGTHRATRRRLPPAHLVLAPLARVFAAAACRLFNMAGTHLPPGRRAAGDRPRLDGGAGGACGTPVMAGASFPPATSPPPRSAPLSRALGSWPGAHVGPPLPRWARNAAAAVGARGFASGAQPARARRLAPRAHASGRSGAAPSAAPLSLPPAPPPATPPASVRLRGRCRRPAAARARGCRLAALVARSAPPLPAPPHWPLRCRLAALGAPWPRPPQAPAGRCAWHGGLPPPPPPAPPGGSTAARAAGRPGAGRWRARHSKPPLRSCEVSKALLATESSAEGLRSGKLAPVPRRPPLRSSKLAPVSMGCSSRSARCQQLSGTLLNGRRPSCKAPASTAGLMRNLLLLRRHCGGATITAAGYPFGPPRRPTASQSLSPAPASCCRGSVGASLLAVLSITSLPTAGGAVPVAA